ncbi:MAG TPA: hypothetical protein VN903_38080 [Polyangia bacterium]|jgi:hypothetical protein|nr:hypothetical protein [Polyangia bacterium]
MRKASTLLGLMGLTVVAPAGLARAQDTNAATPAVTASPAPAPEGRLQVALSFLPMSLGTFNAVYGGMPKSLDAAFAPGGGLIVGYDVLRGLLVSGDGLSVGLAPQVIFNVKPKEDPITTDPDPSMEIDAMARVAYAIPLTDTIAAYGAVLPGFSLIKPKTGDAPKGFVFGFDVGVIMNMTDRAFVSLGGGYQWGFQSRTDKAVIKDENGVEMTYKVTTNVRPDYYRVSLGVGARF